MRVTIVHNFYRGTIPSGEDLNVVEHSSIVGDGVRVEVVSTTNNYLAEHPLAGRMLAAKSGFGLRSEARSWLSRILETAPDCVQIENLAPLIPETLVSDLLEAEIPTVRRWGNYRFRCSSGNNFRGGAPCFDCSGRWRDAPGVLHGCYAESRLATLAVALRADQLHVETALQHVPVSEYVASQLRAEGVPDSQVTVIPNAVPDSSSAAAPDQDRSIVFLGSLVEKKGLATLLDSWGSIAKRMAGAQLLIIGDGPMRPVVERAAAKDETIQYVSSLPYYDARSRVAGAAALVAPSEWDEPFGRVVIEAFSEGVPVVVSDRGALPELMTEGCGWIVPSGDRDALGEAISAALDVPVARRAEMADAVIERYQRNYSHKAVRERWHRLYEESM